MRRKLLVSLALLSILLTGCGEEPEPEPVPVTYLHEQMESVVWNDKTIKAITPCCSFDSSTDKLIVYPYYDNDASVTVEKLLLSENNEFWEAIKSPYTGTDNVVEAEGYSLITLENGNTIGYIELENSMCYWVTSDTLPSGYVQAVLKALCA